VTRTRTWTGPQLRTPPARLTDRIFCVLEILIEILIEREGTMLQRRDLTWFRTSTLLAGVLAIWLAGLLLSSPAFTLEPEADTLVGLWATEDEEAHVRISRDGEKYSGKIVWLSEPVYPPDDERGMGGQTKVDRNNPDETLHDQPILGLEIMDGFTYVGDGLWKGGWIYDPDNGKTYKCKLTLQEDGSLHVRGYIGFSLLGRTSVWTPVEEDERADDETGDDRMEDGGEGGGGS
jgi:uncharacterized protein (DUF2147 family)